VSQLFQYRFGGDTELDGHSFGNLYLTVMTAITGSFEAALAESSRVLAVRGRVMPATLAQVTLCGERVTPTVDSGVSRVERISGESAIGVPGGHIQRVYLEPEDPPAYPAVIRAILDADLIVLGPGSLYTSVLPNLLVPDLMQAITSAPGHKVFVCSVATQTGETEGYHVTDYVAAIRKHVRPDPFHHVLANNTFLEHPPPGSGVDWVWLPESGVPLDYPLVARDLVDRQYPWRHDPAKLTAVLMDLIGEGAGV
jgi:uncharacterized cofD-like protein